jgi:hypothetical protein
MKKYHQSFVDGRHSHVNFPSCLAAVRTPPREHSSHASAAVHLLPDRTILREPRVELALSSAFLPAAAQIVSNVLQKEPRRKFLSLQAQRLEKKEN